jgi:hypothetical protein
MKPSLIIELIPLDRMMLRNIRRAASTSSDIIPDLSDYFEANSVRNKKRASGAQAISHRLNSILATSQKWHNCLYRWCDASAEIKEATEYALISSHWTLSLLLPSCTVLFLLFNYLSDNPTVALNPYILSIFVSWLLH